MGENSAALQGILNFRDVGKTINEFLGEKLLKEGRIFRSARLDDATLSDREQLQDHYGLKTVMDLRTKTEHIKASEKREADRNNSALLKANPALSEPLQIPGITYTPVNVNGKGFERSLLHQLSYFSIFKLVVLMIFGYRLRAISILGREVMNPRGLIGLGRDTLDNSGPELASAIHTYANPASYPILLHCTQGKDRTGLIVLLVLLLLDVPLPAISHDYFLSVEGLRVERESRLKEIRSIGLADEFADCPVDFVEKMVGYLDEKYGGIEGYLEAVGVSKAERDSLVEALRA